MTLDEIEINDNLPLDNTVVGYDGNYVLIEDDEDNQFRLFCEDRDSIKQWFPLGATVDATCMAQAEPTMFERWIGWD